MLSRFFYHLFPKNFNADTLRPTKTFYLGIIITVLFISLIASGVLLLFYYSPDSSSSYSSVIFLEEKVAGGAYIRSFHRMCSHILLIFAALHMLRTVFTGVYSLRPVNWKLGYIIFGLIVFEAYTGYLLPMDQLSFWATKTGMELMNTLPLGNAIKGLLLPDDVGGRLTLLRFFSMHIVLIPFLCSVLISSHLYNIRRDGGLVPQTDAKKADGKKLINFSLMAAAAVFVVALILSVISPAPLGIKADPSTPPNPAKSAWFLLWIQEIVSWRAWFFNIVAVVFFAFYFLPNYGRREREIKSKWFSRQDLPVWALTAALTITVISLTIIAMFFRGKNWELVSFFF